MNTPEGDAPAQAVIVTADRGRVNEIEIDLRQRGYQVSVLDVQRLLAQERRFQLGVFDLSSSPPATATAPSNPVVVAADLLADGRLEHVEFISPHPGIERAKASDPPGTTGQSAVGGDRAQAGQSAAGGDRAQTGQSAVGGDRAQTAERGRATEEAAPAA